MAARLAGIDAVPMERARVLEIGGGDCLSLIAFAAAYPTSRCHGFDLAASAIERGRVIAWAACPNVTLETLDIMAAREHFAPASFDYVIAHGLYAWVPAPVRAELLALIAKVLAPAGVAFVSFNALPGGYIRHILRDMVLHAIAGADDPAQRIAAAAACLEAFAAPQEGDEALLAALRQQAGWMANRPPGLLFHDELGEVFAPQSISQAVQAAGQHGLQFLTDAGPNRVLDGFLPVGAEMPADADLAVLNLAQARDYRELCFFRSLLLTRHEARPDRRIDPARLDGLWVSARFKALGDGEFGFGEDRFTIADPRFAARLALLAEAAPARRRTSEIADNEDQLMALIDLYREWYVQFHLGPPPWAMEPGVKPAASALVRQTLQRGEMDVATMRHRMIRIDQPEVRALLLAADGSRTIAEIAALDVGIPADEVAAALTKAASLGLLAC